VALPDDYWASFEHEVSSLGDYLRAVTTISAYQAAAGSRFAWRGVADASWALHPSLARRYQEQSGGLLPTEEQLRVAEEKILVEAHLWGLDWHPSAQRLTALELLAAMQHYEIPTRMLDFTFNPFIALWFAVEKDDGTDGRVFAIDVADQMVSRIAAAKIEPWWFEESAAADSPWCTQPWIWRPPPIEARIVRQDGCFLFGGIPSTQPLRNQKVAGGWRPLAATEVRECMSVPFTLINYKHAVAAAQGKRWRGKQPSKARSFTLRVKAPKQAIRGELESAFGYTQRSLFPDFPGFADYAKAPRQLI
jgi:hypothetical protein